MISTGVGIAEVPARGRSHEIRRMLVERRRDLLNEIQNTVRDVREVGSNRYHHTTDLGEAVEGEPEDDIVFALIQMKAELLARVDEAVRHCDEGTYGSCVDCGKVIAPSRLRAMPFAVRCRTCQETCEEERHRGRVQLARVPSELGSRY
jgi:DnaK suppressor protein